jgi:hypothetical protein
MGFLDWFKRDRKITDYTPEELRREEGRLQIRENQTIARVEKLEAEREVIFRQGTDVKSPVRRRILARKYEEKKAEVSRLETELSRLSKEAMTVSAIRFRLERRAAGESAILKKIGGGEIEVLRDLFEDDAIGDEMYGEKLVEMLGAVSETAGDPLEGLGEEGRSVLDIWQRLDQGEIESVEEGLREAQDRAEEGLAEPE